MLVSRTCRALLVALLVAAGLVRGARAETGASTFGVLNLESQGVPPELGNAVSEELRRQLAQLSGASISTQDMVEVKVVLGCVDEKPACLARAGRQLGVGWLLYGKLRPQSADATSVVVELHQLHVAKAIVENSISESVSANVLTDGNPELERLAQRWLLRLASPARNTPEPVRPLAPEMKWHRGLWISSAVFGALAGAAALAAVGTWRGIGEAQNSASAHLDLLQGRLTASGDVLMYRDFFESSDQLSRCAAVPGLLGDPDYENYRAVCERGNALATATTGLLAAAGGLAVLSVTSLILSRALRQPVSVPARPRPVRPRLPAPRPRLVPTEPPALFVPAPEDVPAEEPPPAGESKAPGSPANVRLDAILPAVSPRGAGVVLQLSF